MNSIINDLQLQSLGDLVPLNIQFDRESVLAELTPMQDQWVMYNSSKPTHRRTGLSLTSLSGGVDGHIDLDSLLEYNQRNGTQYTEMSFKIPTKYWPELPSITKPIEPYAPYLGRSHVLRLDEGGFFPPHRDLGDSFRLIAFFNGTPDDLGFIIDNQKKFFETERLYYVNTRKAHSLFSFKNKNFVLVLNLDLSSESVNLVQQHLLES